MSYVLMDRAKNIKLAVVGDGAIAEWIKTYYETIGIRVGVTIHDSVICETIDSDFGKPIFVFDI